ncbi:class A beta-lactamase [Phenylobacterium sp.]|uniref:class A beta-lactamase n=1 Tax=Phenylobacterium sp. TaxID=1871053 RepID=UPI002FDB7796
MRRFFAVLALALTVSACEPGMPQTAAETPAMDAQILDAAAERIAATAAPARFGAGFLNLESGELWAVAGSDRFPMQSVFKAPLAAVVLAEVDAGRIALDQVVTLSDEDLSPPFSLVGEAYPERRDYTVEDLIVLATGRSDNTAADVLMRLVGGPGAVTAWLRSHGLKEMRVDRYERQLQPELAGMGSFRPAWKTSAAYREALMGVPPLQRQAATAAYLRDPRDTTTPRDALLFLSKLAAGELLSPASTERLLTIMTETPTGANRLAAGLPDGARLAHKTGTARTDLGLTPAMGDMGIITLADGRRYAVAVFFAGVTLPEAQAEALFADFARAATAAAR